MTDAMYVIGFLSGIVVVSEWLVRNTFFRHIGTATMVIVVTAIFANIGVLPAGSTEANPVPAYDFIFSTIAPLAIFLLLLPVGLRDIIKAGFPMIGMFLLGSFATVAGVLVGMWVVNGPESIGPLYYAVGGMFVGTYTGGSINFNAIALNYDVVRNGVLYGGAVVVDNILTMIWILVTLAVPRLFARVWPIRHSGEREHIGEVTLGIETDTETIHPMDVGMILGLGLPAIWISDQLAVLFSPVPSIIFLTIIALVLAQIPAISRIAGVRVIGMFTVYLFLSVIGAFADIGALAGLGSLGITLLVFTTVTVLVHGLVTYGVALIFRVDPVIASLASQANVGGGTSALALARSLGREDLVLPSVLVGSLGNAVGTFLGFWVSGLLLNLT
jgi:uncharacterized membrane protein